MDSKTQLQEEKERLIRCLKKNVKHLMEESVTKKMVHEESSNVSAVCSSVDNCLQVGLRRRSLGLFKTNSSSALLQKISKECVEASQVLKRIEELEKTGPSGSLGNSAASSRSESSRSFTFNRSIQSVDSSSNLVASKSNRFFWIRISLFEKKLQKIIAFLVNYSERFYESDLSIVGDPDLGPIFASLVVGPCALEFSRVRQADLLWSDPSADELVQRHRISSTPKMPSNNTPTKGILRKALSSQISELDDRRGSIPFHAREYVESLHQNRSSSLLYGKNNVQVVQCDWSDPQPGYLSLHQLGSNVVLKWTPNSLMDGGTGSNSQNANWQQAVTVNLSSILYMHCHQDQAASGTLVLVGVDGIQYPPMNFPPGDNLVTFLGCLEAALLPHGLLSPPLSSAEGSLGTPDTVVKRRSSLTFRRKNSAEAEAEKKMKGKDAVFKIVYPDKGAGHDSLQKTRSVDWFTNIFHMNKKTTGSFNISTTETPTDLLGVPAENGESSATSGSLASVVMQRSPTTPIKGLCTTMKRQIIARAFYGWLGHCRHAKTVRNHLQGLVLPDIPTESDAYREGLTEQVWTELKSEGLDCVKRQAEVYRRIYYGGVEHQLRCEVWQYLLGHLDWADSAEEIQNKEIRMQSEYEGKISEWGALEAIVMQQDREVTAANIARLSLGRSSDSLTSLGLTNDVFSSVDSEQDQGRRLVHDYPHSPTPDRPSTITEVTEHSSGEQQERDKRTSNSSEEVSADQIGLQKERKCPRTSWRSKVSASDEGIEDITEECSSLCSHPGTLQLTAIYKVTTPSIDSGNPDSSPPDRNHVFMDERMIERRHSADTRTTNRDPRSHTLSVGEELELLPTCEDLLMPTPVSTCPSPASSEGGVYTLELMESFGLNLHRIEKDVARCDRNLPYFTHQQNLDKLRNIVTTYVWEHLEVGYMQGMCDLVAPLLVVIDDEMIVFSCFQVLMERMIQNFPTGDQMDHNFANMRALMQVLDHGLYHNIQQNGDFSHFYFCYRWFLLDFKREFCYSSVYRVWETIWAARQVASPQYHLFIALGLVETYRDIIIDRNMDFTDIIKFFNEMAEKHEDADVLESARELVDQLREIAFDAEM